MNQDSLAKLRLQMDEIDQELCALLLRRLKISHEIQATKAKMGSSNVDPKREELIVQQLNTRFPAIPPATLRELYAAIFTWMRGKA